MLDGLPRGESFNWVDKVSIELTGQMLATLFDFPFEDRRKLSYWSDVSTAVPYPGGLVESEEQREAVFRECLGYFMNLWNERVNAEPRPDLISMLAHGEATRHMSAREYLGNVILLRSRKSKQRPGRRSGVETRRPNRRMRSSSLPPGRTRSRPTVRLNRKWSARL